MNRAFAMVVATFLPLAAHAVQLQEIQGSSCGQWTEVQAAGNTVLGAQFRGWVMGFMSGWAWSHPKADPLLNRDAAGLLAWIDNYCKANPLDSIATASEKLAIELDARSGTKIKK
jgi:hypothetical protein